MACWFHKWSKWSPPYLLGWVPYSRRYCTKCGKVEERLS